MADYKKPEDLMGQNSLLQQLTKASTAEGPFHWCRWFFCRAQSSLYRAVEAKISVAQNPTRFRIFSLPNPLI